MFFNLSFLFVVFLLLDSLVLDLFLLILQMPTRLLMFLDVLLIIREVYMAELTPLFTLHYIIEPSYNTQCYSNLSE